MRSAALFVALPLALAAPLERASPAPPLKHRDADVVAGKYIVKTRSRNNDDTLKVYSSMIAGKVDYTYNSNNFFGFAASMTPEEVETLQNMSDVEYIEPDAVVRAYTTQNDADWGLARLSSASTGGGAYTYDDSAGEGVCAYILDTGIDVDHPDFEGRAIFASNQVDHDNTDGHGHGTHVAGIIGSKTFGVAKKASLYAVKVLNSDGGGTNAAVIAGMDFVISDAVHRDCPKGVVVNLSLGGAVSSAVNQAAANVVSAGIFMAVAAGNEGTDASSSSPASEPTVCTVGATDKTDTFCYFSNYGSLVDVLAPGSDIESTWPGGGTNIISGTSMASPHVAGIGAYFLGLGAASPENLCDYIASKAQIGAIGYVPSDTTNSIIQNGEN